MNPVEVLLVEDDPGDVELTREAMDESRILVNLHVVGDGLKALEFLRNQGEFQQSPRPDLILLDLNLPRKSGREVLEEMKADPDLKSIPVVVLTTSEAEQDISKTYHLGANCFITKPIGFSEFLKVVKSINDFWFAMVKLPPKGNP